MAKKSVTGIIVVGAALGAAWLLLKGKAQASPTRPPILLPTITHTPTGRTVVTPAPGTAGNPPAVIVPPAAVTSPTGQVQIYNARTGDYAWTDLGNLPMLVAGGWAVVTTPATTNPTVAAPAGPAPDGYYWGWTGSGWELLSA
jgi:hypothetical protein